MLTLTPSLCTFQTTFRYYRETSSPVSKRHSAEVNERDQLKDRLATAQKPLDIDSLVHMQKTTFPQGTLPHWHLILAAVSCTFTGLQVLYVAVRSKLQCSTSYCLRTDKSPQDGTPRSPIHAAPASEHLTTAAY